MWSNRNWHLKTPLATLFWCVWLAHERRALTRPPWRPLRWQSTMKPIHLLPSCSHRVLRDWQSFLRFPLGSQNSLRFSLGSQSSLPFRLDSQTYCCDCRCPIHSTGSAIVTVTAKTTMSKRMVMWLPIVVPPSKSYDSAFQSMHCCVQALNDFSVLVPFCSFCRKNIWILYALYPIVESWFCFCFGFFFKYSVVDRFFFGVHQFSMRMQCKKKKESETLSIATIFRCLIFF